MKPERLAALIKNEGKMETYAADQVFHAQDFINEELFMLKKGYVKRYQVTDENKRVIELIYGPGYIFPLTHLYKKMFSADHNQEDLIYVYQAMTDIEIYHLDAKIIIAAAKDDNKLYIDLFYEAGLRLKANIDRLASNALDDDYKKIAHQLVCLANEFGKQTKQNDKQGAEIAVPLGPKDIAEQLNISVGVASAILGNLEKKELLVIKNNSISIPDLDMLKDVYL